MGGKIFAGFLIVMLLGLTFGWLAIPSKATALELLDIASLTFANGILVGWADDLAIFLFHSDSEVTKNAALHAFRNATLYGESAFPRTVAIFNLVGAFLSIGGVVAVWLARSASTTGGAFRLGFFAELAEGVIYHIGYYATTGLVIVSKEEIGISVIVALIMGGVATTVFKRTKR